TPSLSFPCSRRFRQISPSKTASLRETCEISLQVESSHEFGREQYEGQILLRAVFTGCDVERTCLRPSQHLRHYGQCDRPWRRGRLRRQSDGEDEATGITYEMNTTSGGTYTFSSVTPGQYAVTVSKPGFRKFTSVHNILTVGVPLVVDAQLQVGAASETVEVQSSYERIETTSAQVSDIVPENDIKNLPLNGRNPLTLLTLEPGVVQRTNNAAGS